MGTLQTLLDTIKNKPALKQAWQGATSGTQAWFDARSAFFAADTQCEELAQELVKGDSNEFADEVEMLDGDDVRLLRRFFAERGLPWPDDSCLLSLVRKYKRTDAMLAAFKQLASLRRNFEPEDLSAGLAQAPYNVQEKTWRQAVTLFDRELAAIGEERQDAPLVSRQSEAEFNCTARARRAADQAGDALSRVVSDLLERGTFESTIVQECPDELRWLRNYSNIVPRTQPLPQTR